MPRPLRPEPARLTRLAERARAQAEARSVAEGVAETVALSRARGQAIEGPRRPGRREPYRRQTGLAWLARKGRIDAQSVAAGELYGLAWRRAMSEASIPSSWSAQPGGGGGPPTPDLARVLAHGEAAEAARRRLAAFRRRLAHQPDLVAACDLVCGQEMTPREAARGDRDAARIETLLKVALDILAHGPTP